MRSHAIRQAVVLATGLIAALVVGTQAVGAFSVVSHTGAIGVYSLSDVASPSGHQSAICFYDTSTFKLETIDVRHPQVRARNRTSGRDSQWVGWQYVVQHEAPTETTWHTIYSSSFVKAKAYDNLAAAFSNRSWTAPTPPSGRYRLLVAIRWYTPGSSTVIQGSVRLLDQNYESKWNGHAVISQGSCLQDY